ncbi:hypothetical protein GCM10010266_68060 [Streptomyces griseomycini]|uniref:Uncharacterized protein n=1 Tax=Streptomyces griseomycini TaxID=66895 RepID=A0A7W7PWT7_9ACTN|nr:hypothetical protein [Streptomyces griseomycini]GGQ35049.1 hypothetical protein GCM10010266_68060 [Streptomyces griseomycini]GGR54763.1 hypothetical protein GCM10015536_70100 [Streptomyces griseomycini]
MDLGDLLNLARDAARAGARTAASWPGPPSALSCPRCAICAAGILPVQQAGGTAGDLTGPVPGNWPRSGDVLAAPAGLWKTLQALLAPVLLSDGGT